MAETGKRAENATITELGIHNSKVYWNLTSNELADISLKKGEATKTSTGAININTGEFTGRSPMDRFIVKDDLTKDLFGGETLTYHLIKKNLINFIKKY